MSTGQKIGVTIFSVVFILIGAALLYGITIGPLLLARQIQSWVAIPCTVLTSVIRTDRSTANPTYEAEVRYRYTFNRETYVSSNYTYASNYSSDLPAKQAIVAQYPPGTETICFVNPASPAEAVLNREKPTDLWTGLIGLPFFLVGLGFFVFVIVQTIKPLSSAARTDSPQTPALRLKPVKSQGGTLTFLALFWNIFMAFAIYMVTGGWKTRPDYFSAGILLLFAIVGLVLLYSVLSRALVIFGPRVDLKVLGYRLRPGERFELSWNIRRAFLLKGIEIWLKGGVHLIPVYVSADKSVPARGQTSVKFPEDNPTNNFVIHFVGHVKRLPNIDKKYVLTLW